jgi:hypothetical protein
LTLRSLRVLAPAVVALALAAGTAPAHADSLVYAKDGNVWVAGPDGANQRQLTTDGSPEVPYESPSQADDGTVLALRGTRFYRFDHNGQPLGAPLDSVLTNPPNPSGAVGPFDPQISPDGTKIAYWLGIFGGWYDYATNTYYNDPESATVWQRADTGQPLPSTAFYESPSWLADSSGALVFEPTNILTPQVRIAAAGANHHDTQGWFHDRDTLADPMQAQEIGSGELTRAGDKLAVLRGTLVRGSGNSIQLYSVTGLSTAPQMWPCPIVGATGGEFGKPTWAPSGAAIAWAEADGIWTSPVGSDCSSLAPRLTIPGASQPDWGPADPGAAAAAAAAAPAAPAPAPAPRATPARPASTLGVAAPRSIRRAALLHRGLRVSVTCTERCKVAATLRYGHRRIARRTGRRSKAGRITLTVRVARRRLAAVPRRAPLRLAVTATTPSGRPQHVTRTVAVRG